MIYGFTGHRKFNNSYDINAIYLAVKEKIRTTLLGNVPSEIISGMAIGTDTIAAELAIELGIPLIAAVPFVGQEARWNKETQAKYYMLLSKAKDVIIVCKGGYAAFKMQLRNEWMVDHSDKMIAVFNGSPGGTFNCVKYAVSVGKNPLIINPDDL